MSQEISRMARNVEFPPGWEFRGGEPMLAWGYEEGPPGREIVIETGEDDYVIYAMEHDEYHLTATTPKAAVLGAVGLAWGYRIGELSLEWGDEDA